MAALTAASGSVMYVRVHSFTLGLVALHCNPSEQFYDQA